MAAIHRRGWCEGTGGNFSCVLERNPLRLLMAPSGVHKGRVPPEDLIVVDGQGRVCRGAGRASAETLLHLAIVETTGAGAVLHTHSQAGTLLSQRLGSHHAAELMLGDLEMLKGLDGVRTHATAVALPVLPNDQDLHRLSQAARPLLPHAPHGLLIAGHGLYAWGKDLNTAERHLEILEFLLEQRWRQLLLEPESLRPRQISGISHVLLDIEGTTCPVSFVSEVLFPYAAERLEAYLSNHRNDPQVQALVAEVQESWRRDGEAAAAGLPWSSQQAMEGQATQAQAHPAEAAKQPTPEKHAAEKQAAENQSTAEDSASEQLTDKQIANRKSVGQQNTDKQTTTSVAAYLRWLMQIDRKLTPLKDLQGRIWEQGYGKGELTGPLFPDVPAALRRWQREGLTLAVYSSGSVPAQQLLYGHSSAGDLRPLFQHWFDTRIGSKQDPISYQRIADGMATEPSRVLFISDALAECHAARDSGMAVLYSERPGNPQKDRGPFETISDYSNLVLTP